MNRVILSAAVLAFVAGAHANIVFSDGFESGDFSNWTGDGNTEPEVPTIVTDPVYAGTYAASVVGTSTGGSTGIGRKYKSFAPVATTETLTFSFYMKLGAASANNRQFAELRSYTADTWGGSTGFDQILAIGAFNGNTNVLNADNSVGALNNSGKWQARVTLSGYANGGWFVLDQAANRTTDWTKFEVVVAPTGIEFFVDGVKGHNGTFSRGTSATWTADTVVLGSGLSSAGTTSGFDNVSVSTGVVPEPASMIALGIGALALVRKRRASK